LEELLVQRFLRDGKPVDQKEVNRVLTAAGKAASALCADRTHFIACHLMIRQEPDELQVGPVIFRTRRSFAARIGPEVRAFRPQGNASDYRGGRRKALLEVLSYYKAFKWVAEVTVPNSDAELSEALALRTATSALNCLHLILGASGTTKMEVGGPALRRDHRGGMTISGGQMSLTASLGGKGQVGFPEGWSAAWDRDDFRELRSLCALAMDTELNPSIRRPISRRFLDAAHWFGEAVREKSSATKIIKYVTALECMVMTDETDDTTRLLCERIAVLCFDPSIRGDRATWHERARVAYGLRSGIVHGSISPTDTRAMRGLRDCSQLAEATLRSAIQTLGEEALLADQASNNKLDLWFQNQIQIAEALEAQRFPPESVARPSTDVAD